MVGYVTNGYRLWNLEKKEIKLSRDATFVESTEVSATNNLSQEIIADIVSLVDSKETSLRLANNMEKAGLDYSETFSSGVSLNALRFLITYAKMENMFLDGLVISNEYNKIEELMMKLQTEFEVKITDNSETFVGLGIENARGFINIHQESYVEHLLKTYNMDSAKLPQFQVLTTLKTVMERKV
ncbi:hypothetical protein PR048_011177 [Dryococelus australis]|uniref:Retroviral polymerase SH3-like domain-containing protein n=1 Tax=Dryococelus australis TaxID=614101 RepID=A0ABQ9HKW5_9NEOP|nr:hypothetical protein PR048_011177 [Dryococelus australis]